jgi:glutamate-5-semialdehyde dehydrogenase
MSPIEQTITRMAQAARRAAKALACCPTRQKNAALRRMAEEITRRADTIEAENRKDLAAARAAGLSAAMIDRLTVDGRTLAAMAQGLNAVAELPDPVGSLGPADIRPNGLRVARMRIPLGVIGIIYEARPNVTVDAAGLCLKAGNAAILRGGSEALHSNRALAAAIAQSLADSGLPEAAVQVVPVKDRAAVNALLKQEESIDLIIPRGGEELIRFVVAHSRIPVLKHYKGVCHVYVDEGADLAMAAARRLQCHGDPAGAPVGGRAVSAGDGAALPRGRGGAAGVRADAAAGARGRPGGRVGLAGRVLGPDPGGARGGRYGGRHRPYRRLWLEPHRGHRHPRR